ncbi:hypothetical protein CANCADRAFT_4511 [Tortispora caseinolytica NRRL Y-17796]|uniref:Uncharacterized protein n=1 Tax=Tortispora caseinolytica NRRL Y-17796 TaxID=767744 RepID=A0A1E4T9E7_9ASCO|nr:hypothetical protein CANCADRAFT_4511 [Tortispora caseinolytica NRRL Y-17796]
MNFQNKSIKDLSDASFVIRSEYATPSRRKDAPRIPSSIIDHSRASSIFTGSFICLDGHEFEIESAGAESRVSGVCELAGDHASLRGSVKRATRPKEVGARVSHIVHRIKAKLSNKERVAKVLDDLKLKFIQINQRLFHKKPKGPEAVVVADSAEVYTPVGCKRDEDDELFLNDIRNFVPALKRAASKNMESSQKLESAIASTG